MTDAVPDGTIVAAVLAGDAERFGLLVHRYEDPLRRAAYSRLGRSESAEDAVQETFLCVFKSLHTYDSRFSFRTWLWTILVNQCRRCQKKASRQPFVLSWSNQPTETVSEDWTCLLPTEETPIDSLLAGERAELLDRLLRQLPVEQADALRLRFFGDLKFREIADAMNCSLSTAKNRVRWGLEKYRPCWRKTKIPLNH